MDSSDEELDVKDLPLNITWYECESFCGPRDGAVGLSELPGAKIHGEAAKRNLHLDLETLKTERVEHVILLVKKGEMRRLGVPDILDEYKHAEVHVSHYPFEDGTVPDVDLAKTMVSEVTGLLNDGKRVIIQCRGGLGRSGTVLAIVMLDYIRKCNGDTRPERFRVDPDKLPGEVIELVRQRRGQKAIQTVKQYNFISDF